MLKLELLDWPQLIDELIPERFLAHIKTYKEWLFGKKDMSLYYIFLSKEILLLWSNLLKAIWIFIK